MRGEKGEKGKAVVVVRQKIANEEEATPTRQK